MLRLQGTIVRCSISRRLIEWPLGKIGAEAEELHPFIGRQPNVSEIE